MSRAARANSCVRFCGVRPPATHQANVGFVHERRWLQSVTRPLVPQVCAREAVKFGVDKWQ